MIYAGGKNGNFSESATYTLHHVANSKDSTVLYSMIMDMFCKINILSIFTSVIAILTVIRFVTCIYIQEPLDLCPVWSVVVVWIYAHCRLGHIPP